MPQHYWTIPELLKKRRRILHYTQADLGQMLGVSRAAVSQWECGFRNPGSHNLYDLAKCLEMTEYQTMCVLKRLGE
jgi:transcriptional regulator with XRE-family HTH domain